MLSIRNIIKQYAGHRAPDDVSLEVKTGEIFGKILGVGLVGLTQFLIMDHFIRNGYQYCRESIY